jgi:hypothetical protein
MVIRVYVTRVSIGYRFSICTVSEGAPTPVIEFASFRVEDAFAHSGFVYDIETIEAVSRSVAILAMPHLGRAADLKVKIIEDALVIPGDR